jgi:hypothetical protein
MWMRASMRPSVLRNPDEGSKGKTKEVGCKEPVFPLHSYFSPKNAAIVHFVRAFQFINFMARTWEITLNVISSVFSSNS